MDLPSLLVLAVGLAMDATAVAAARGVSTDSIRLRDVLLVSFLFGGFQAGMPLLGYGLGTFLSGWLESAQHWVAFAVLAVIGGKMLHEAFTHDEETIGGRDPDTVFGWRVLLALALATSIDALAVGVTLPLLDAPLAASIATIGVTTAILSAAGLWAGRKLGAMLGKRLDAFGGLVLLAIGMKVLLAGISGGN